jgi:hypothetical protein
MFRSLTISNLCDTHFKRGFALYSFSIVGLIMKHLRIGGYLATGVIASSVAFSQSVLVDGGDAMQTDLLPPTHQCSHYTKERQPFFGDLHVHTAYSLDASTQGTRNLPRDAYKFARGEKIGLQPYAADGKPTRFVQLKRALDFAVVTDHAELFGEVQICQNEDLEGSDSMICWVFREMPRLAFILMNSSMFTSPTPTRYKYCGENGERCMKAALTPWADTQLAAEAAYDRSSDCRFTSFVGYEWSGTPNTNNMHRNIIFANEHVPENPVTYIDEPDANALLAKLEDACSLSKPGCDFIAIPHNSNLSGGKMFDIGESEAAASSVFHRRQEKEKLFEVIQHKGASECLPGGFVKDELCDFEKLPYDNYMRQFVPIARQPPSKESYIRYALGKGMALEKSQGKNPFRYGFVGATDTHFGTPGLVDEEKFVGHGGAGRSPSKDIPFGLPDKIEFNPGGLTAVWAEENTREALFSAMKRRETYATSGPRIPVRFYGGWQLDTNICDTGLFVKTGYEKGVAMGSVLEAPKSALGSALESALGSALESGPQFAVWALKDVGQTGRQNVNLEKAQIIKVWEEEGATQVKIFDLGPSVSKEDAIDMSTCEPKPKGHAQLCHHWQDPEFTPGNNALYYARIMQMPTCRWNAFQCVDQNINCESGESIPDGWEPCCEPSTQKSIQERAWTSPIWYDASTAQKGETVQP